MQLTQEMVTKAKAMGFSMHYLPLYHQRKQTEIFRLPNGQTRYFVRERGFRFEYLTHEKMRQIMQNG